MLSKINSFESACQSLTIDHTQLPLVSNLPEYFQRKSVADYKADVIIKALNDEGQDKPWVADY